MISIIETISGLAPVKTRDNSNKELITALVYCAQGIALLNESHPQNMTIYLRLSHRHAIAVLKSYGVNPQEMLEMA